MIASMTAFARRDVESTLGSFSWEMRAVNHRYLELTVRLPDDLRYLESQVRERIGGRFARGKVECALRFRPGSGAGVQMHVNEALLQRLVGAVHAVEQKFLALSPGSAFDILRWPGVLNVEEVNKDALQAAAMEALAGAIDDFQKTRAREGAKLAETIMQRCATLATRVGEVRARLPQLVPQFRQRLVDRLAAVRQELDPQRLEQEIVMFAQRVDVAEELDRLDVHVEEVRRIMNEGGAVGRRLDFLMQELNREANTLASKSADVELTRLAVDMKVLIEQMREQVQNIE